MKARYTALERLKSKKEISALFDQGTNVSAYPLKLFYIKNNLGLKVGVSVSKRNFKKAVDRNHIKRLLRESCRLNKSLLKNNDIEGYSLMILYISPDLPDFKTINKQTQQLFKKLIVKINI